MYENITYEQLRDMPDDQKTEVLKEMLKVYPDAKSIAAKIGAAPIAISNLIGRLIEGKHVGRVKGSKNTPIVENNKPDEVKTQEVITPELTPTKRKYTRKVKVENDNIPISNPIIEVKKQAVKASNAIEGTILGTELIKRLEGLAKGILEDKTYSVIIKTEET